ncbi:MAG: sel1 repeat family protein [Clostridia bacterium]|nr:sel1 repeat family protein [Clostridia bacterium]
MNQYLVSALTSIIDAKGECVIDNKDVFMNIFTASTKGCEDITSVIELALASGAVMIIAQAKNDDNEGQENATKIAIEILMSEGVDKNLAIDVATAFGVAFGFSYGKEKTEAQLLDDAYAHVTKQEYEEAIKLVKYLMTKGNSGAYLLMGELHYNGIGTPKSYKKAIECFEKAANGDAYSKLAVMYAYGYGCDKCFSKAMEYWNMGATLGNSVCEYQLAMVYMNGISGINKDILKAASYIKSAASKGFAPAVKAMSALPKEYTEKTEAEVNELEKAVDSGDIRAIYTLANCYFKGDGVPQSKIKAVDLYTKAAKMDHLPSQLVLITRYTMDKDIPKAWSAAEYWYNKAAANKAKLSAIHTELVRGEELYHSVPKNAKNKRERYEEAGKLGYISAYTAIAKMYRDGEKALPWLTLSAEAGDIEALELILKRDDIDKSKYQPIYEYVKDIMEKCSI